MKSITLVILALLHGTPVLAERQGTFDEAGKFRWLPITLTDDERELLANRSDPPRTALDYYLLLSSSYFSNIADDTERRITFIDRETLNDTYLHAEYTIPTTDAGTFWITIRLFESEGNPLIAISHLRGSKRIFVAKENGPQDLWSISLNKPELWHYRGDPFAEGGALLRIPDSVMPEVPVEDILDRYRNHYKAHLAHPGQKKSIWLTYELPEEGKLVQVTGRENFMDPGERYVWAEFTYNGDRFVPSTNSEQDGVGQPATRPESE